MSYQKIYKSQGEQLLLQLFLRGKRIFTISDAEKTAMLEKIPRDQLNKILFNLSKQGKILRLRRGLYVAIGILPNQINTHPFVISAFLVQPSMISHWSALQHHGLTEQISPIITASTTHKIITPSMREKQSSQKITKHGFNINDTRYEYINIQEKNYFGYEKIWLDENFHVNITDKERTLLDLFIYPKMFGGIGEALGILENSITTVDIQKLVKYAIRYSKKSIAKRVGWALENLYVEKKLLLPLLEIPIHHYCRIDSSKAATGPCDKRWMIQNNLTNETKQLVEKILVRQL